VAAPSARPWLRFAGRPARGAHGGRDHGQAGQAGQRPGQAEPLRREPDGERAEATGQTGRAAEGLNRVTPGDYDKRARHIRPVPAEVDALDRP
jgi:hypothetical protein